MQEQPFLSGQPNMLQVIDIFLIFICALDACLIFFTVLFLL